MYRKALSTQTKADWKEYNNQNLAELVSSVIDCIFQRPRSLERVILSPQQRLTLPHSCRNDLSITGLTASKRVATRPGESGWNWGHDQVAELPLLQVTHPNSVFFLFLAVSHAPTRKEWRLGGTKARQIYCNLNIWELATLQLTTPQNYNYNMENRF